jgi:dynein heavy chain
VEEALALLEDQLVKSQAMGASPLAAPFEERLGPWEAKLRRFQVRLLCTFVRAAQRQARQGGVRASKKTRECAQSCHQPPHHANPTTQAILEAWLSCQGRWLYLQPIFCADEILKQIPREGAAFRAMDAAWRRIVEQVGASVWVLCTWLAR